MLENFRSQKIIWDRANKKIFEKIEANSGDSNGRKLVVQVIDQGVTEGLSGTTLSLGWKSRNGAKGLDAFNLVDASKGIFEIYYTTEMLSNIGNIEASLILIDSTSRIESSTFTISVRPSTVDDESVESENSFTALTEALVKVNDLEDNYAPRLNEVTAQLAQKVDEVVFDTNTQIIKFYANDILVQSINLVEAENMSLVTDYIDTLIADGQIQGVSVMNDSISPDKTTFIKTGNNKANFDDFIRNANFDSIGNVVESDTRDITNFIKVNSGDSLYIYYGEEQAPLDGQVLYMYDKSFNYLGRKIGYINGEAIEQPNLSYVRTAIAQRWLNEFFGINVNSLKTHEPYKEFLDGIVIRREDIDNTEIINGSVTKEKLSPELKKVVNHQEVEVRNVVKNGNFNDGVNEWRLNDASYRIEDNELILSMTSDTINNPTWSILQTNYELNRRDKFFFSVELKPDITTTAVLALRGKSTEYLNIEGGKWNFVSEVIDIDTPPDALERIYVYFNTIGYNIGQEIGVRNINVINLSVSDETIRYKTKEALDYIFNLHGFVHETENVDLVNKAKQVIGSVVGETLSPRDATEITSHLHGKVAVFMGDSITGNAFEHDYPSYVGERTGLNVHNVGFGGTRAGKHGENYDRFSFYRLANCIAQNDYSSLHLPFPDQPWTYPARIEILENIDWNEVDILTIAYGANDWRANSPVDLENLRDENSFKGALRSGIETILQAYPHLQIIIMSPFYRFNTAAGWDSDDELDYGNKGIMKDYWVASKEIATEFKFPHFDAYYSLGINALNKSQYFAEPDGTHHIEKGRELIGHKLASFMLSKL